MTRAFLLVVLTGLTAAVHASAQSSSAVVKLQIEAHEQKAQQFLSEKNPESAIKEYAAAVELDPTNVTDQANLGVLLFFQQDYALAEAHLRVAVDTQPSLTNIRALLGVCEKQLGNMDAARADLESSVPQLSQVKIQVQAGLELVEIYSAANELEKASNILAILREKSPTDPRVLYAAYRIYSDLTDQAMLDLSLADPNSAQAHQMTAHELARRGDLNGAIANFRKALAADPRLPGIHFELAEALHASPDLPVRAQAEAEYRLALAENPKDNKAWTKLGDIAVDKGQLDEAAEDYSRASKISSSDTNAVIGLARVDLEKNDLSSAASLLESVVAGDPSNVLAHYRLSAVYRRLKRPEDSRRELDAYEKYKAMKENLRSAYTDAPSNTPPPDVKVGDSTVSGTPKQ